MLITNKFMDELRRERSVELSYEAHRWVDIRRWGVAHFEKYRRKTSLRVSSRLVIILQIIYLLKEYVNTLNTIGYHLRLNKLRFTKAFLKIQGGSFIQIRFN